MAKQSDSTTGTLEFGDIHPDRPTVNGVFTDPQRNKFRLHITATNKKYLEKFIRAQTKLAKQGKGMQFAISEPGLGTLSSQDPSEGASTSSSYEYFELKQSVTIKIREPKSTTGPYNLELAIDKPMTVGKGDGILFEIRNKSNIVIECKSTDNPLVVQLFDFTNDARQKKLDAELTVPGGQTGYAQRTSQNNVNWQILVIGLEPSEFQLHVTTI